MHYDYTCNGELKKELRANRISYRDIADKLYYSLQNVKLWFSRPISSDRELLIKQAIQEIKKERGANHDNSLEQ